MLLKNQNQRIKESKTIILLNMKLKNPNENLGFKSIILIFMELDSVN